MIEPFRAYHLKDTEECDDILEYRNVKVRYTTDQYVHNNPIVFFVEDEDEDKDYKMGFFKVIPELCLIPSEESIPEDIENICADYPLHIEDIPTDVLRSIYNKWDRAYENGWSPHLWEACALCKYCFDEVMEIEKRTGIKVYSCDICPLPYITPSYCDRGCNATSLLFISSHPSFTEWRHAILGFLEMIDFELEHRMEGERNEGRTE